MDIQNLNLRELNFSEKQQIHGGGWLADTVADFVNWMKCTCEYDSSRVARYKAIGL